MNREAAKILVVDDQQENRDMLSRRLERKGFAVTTANEGSQAIKLIQNEDFDVVLLDILMPGVDGLEVLQKLKECDGLNIPPIIMLSAIENREMIVHTLEHGANDYVTKPIDFPVLMARIQSQISRKRAESALLSHQEKLEQIVEERTAKLQESERRFKLFAEAASDWFWQTDSDLIISEVSERFFEVTNIKPFTIIGKPLQNVLLSENFSSPHPQTSLNLKEYKPFRDIVHSLQGPDGNIIHVSASGVPEFDGNGNFLGYRGTGTDLTQIIKAEARASAAHNLLTEAIEGISDGFALFDNNDRLVLFNDSYRTVNPELSDFIKKGVSFEEIAKAIVARGIIKPEENHEEEWLHQRMKMHRNPGRPIEIQRADGKYLQVTEYKTRDGGILTFVSDITGRKKTEIEHRQSQKMQALGQLTGGVAHDFNNLLTIILGNVELIERSIDGDERLKKRLRATHRAAERGADLTRQLLAFGRRQVLETKTTNIHEILFSIATMLKRTIGENIHINIIPNEDEWRIRVDPGQLENAILNLCINARDAMHNGGSITINTANVEMDKNTTISDFQIENGPYVKVVVADTGTGMSKEVINQAFEPFFTTKKSGQGTGLGLSMVYGFTKQSKGYIDIQSKEGAGTAISLFFPAYKESTNELPGTPNWLTEGHALQGNESILIVEDEPDVRDISVSILEDLGYRTLIAGDGNEALEILDKDDDIDLIFSDVVMPGGMTGVELCHKALDLFPDIKVLLTSGYTKDAMFEIGDRDNRLHFIPKPFETVSLARKVRSILNHKEGGPHDAQTHNN